MRMWRISGVLAIEAAVLLALVAVTAALPGPYAGFPLDDIRRPVYRGSIRTRESKSDAEVIVRSDISVIDGRAASVTPTLAPTTATPIAESLKMVTKQLLQAPSATDMVATDVRTPPKVKSQVKGEITDFVPIGKGEAHPVVIDDTSAYEIITSAPPKPSTPPSAAGLSTWILLTNGEQSTMATKKKVTTQTTIDPKKKLVSTTTTMPDKSNKKTEEIKVGKPGIVKPVPAPVKKANITREEPPPKASPLILQDSKFRNRTPVVVGRIPAIDKNDNSNDIKKVTTTPVPPATANTTTLATPTTVVTKKKTSPLSTKHTFDIVPTTSLLLETDTVETTEETSTTEPTTTTTKRTRRPSNKKKKKNKNRRRRPSKPDSDAAESKIEDNAMASKIETSRPISTRIYNYLAREVMPSVGVGIVGLVLTAGLAGLFLYPFGGGVARRNYDKGPNPLSDSHMYYYNSYSPHQETELNNVQPEEKVFGQVLSSMNQNSFSPSPSYDNGKYSASNHKYRYDMHDYTVNGYAGSNDYSTLPDSVKNGHYQASDSSKYYSMDPVSTHYKLTDGSSQSDSFKSEGSNYPSLTEYTSYTNAASVGTISAYDSSDNSNNDTNTGEDKSDKSQPQFSALVGSPSFTNSDFVGSVSLTGSYGAQEVRHRTGALAASDHGPRKLERTKRDVHDDFLNEIDSTDEKLLRKPVENPTTPGRIETTTMDTTGITKDSFDSVTMTTKTDETTKAEPNLINNIETSTDPIINGTDNSDDSDKDVTDSPDGVTTYGSDAGFFGFLRRLAQVKLKLGISLLRSTGEAFQRYLNTMAKRMESAVRNMENKRRSAAPTNQWTSISSSSSPLRKSRSDRFKRFAI
ncbi:hypothetical protein O3M35_000312 [Rhynocoris fuscipes]|uniref:Uncharacterized protein n=1 Tax=Rhynocoris fuscipes TaxID=488301 RepID=A0AAW1DSC2_9HEMI